MFASNKSVASSRRSAGVLRKQRRNVNSNVGSPPCSPIAEHPPALDTHTISSAASTSIYFASAVSYDDDDGLEDFFARKLASELADAITTPPENALARPSVGHSADYFTFEPVSPVSAHRDDNDHMLLHGNVPEPTLRHRFAHGVAPVTSVRSKLRKPSRLAKQRVSQTLPVVETENPQAGLFRRLTHWKRRSTPDASAMVAEPDTMSPADIASAINGSATDTHPHAHPQEPYIHGRPSASIRQPSKSDIGHGSPVVQSDSYTSWGSTSLSGHGHDWSPGSPTTYETPATSVGSLTVPSSPPPVPPLPGKTKLHEMLIHLQTQQQSMTSASTSTPSQYRRKPVPLTLEPDDIGLAVGQAFLDLDPQPFPKTSSLEPEVTGSAISNSSPDESQPTPASIYLPRLRPPLLRMGSSRRWTLPSPQARALLCAQEIVETEENYRRALGQLLRGETLLPPPAKLCALIPSLLAASPRFAACAGGPAQAFLLAVPSLERALVEWCCVAGAFFNPFGSETSPGRVLRSRRHSRVLDQFVAERLGFELFAEGKDGDGEDGAPRKRKTPSVQDLAIQPTQRVVRYVLLFRELLEHTYGEEREDVQRALDEAVRIAKQCDEALAVIKPPNK